MFLKFTRLDGSPIWLNSAFIVTVEPRRQGGSTVVPIGDGLDYDVRETPETVLGMIAEVPVRPNDPVVVPVPPPKAMPEKFVDVISGGLSAPTSDGVDACSAPAASAVADEAPAKKTTRKRKTAKTADAVESSADAEAKPKKATRGKRKTKESEATESESAENAVPADAATTEPAAPVITVKPLPAGLSAEQIERLRRMAPGSLKKLQNTLASHFRVGDVAAAVQKLVDDGVIRFEQDHVVYGDQAQA